MEEDLFVRNERILIALSKRISQAQGISIDQEDIFYAVFMLKGKEHDMEWIADVWDLELEEDSLFKLLNNLDFKFFQKGVEIEFEAIEDIQLIERKWGVKIKNSKWQIHRNDADPFPSNPHAHELINNVKCDLSNGACYRNNVFKKYIKRKHLMKLREAAKQAGFKLPPLSV